MKITAVNAAPEASNVQISGATNVGDTLTGSYTYSDTESDPQSGSTFRWLSNATNTTAGANAISGATNTTYVITPADRSRYLFYCVTPVASTGTSPGTEVCSTGTQISNNALTLAVTKTADTNDGICDASDCSLREAVANAVSGDTIQFAGGLNGETITLGSNANVAAGVTFDADPANTLTIAGSTLMLAGNLTVTNGAGDTLTIASVLAGSGSLTKSGAGTLTLSGINTYSGATTLSGGTLLVNGALASSVAVDNGATLGGTGSISNAVTINNISVLTAGTASGTGSFATRALTVASGGTLAAQINGTTAGTGYDQVNVTGAVNVSNATLALTLGFTPTVGDSFTLINNDGSDPINGTFSGLAQSATFTVSGQTFQINYSGGTGNDLTLTVVDATPPTVQSVAPPANATYKIGDNLDFIATFSESVTVTNTPRLSLMLGSSTVYANYASGSPGTALTFRGYPAHTLLSQAAASFLEIMNAQARCSIAK